VFGSEEDYQTKSLWHSQNFFERQKYNACLGQKYQPKCQTTDKWIRKKLEILSGHKEKWNRAICRKTDVTGDGHA
jgi:hypothetical protein